MSVDSGILSGEAATAEKFGGSLFMMAIRPLRTPSAVELTARDIDTHISAESRLIYFA